MIKYLKGDLFDKLYEVEGIINTVNTVGIMGKGIALEFKKRFPDNTKEYEKRCKEKSIGIGKSFVYKLSNYGDTQYIINFPTKMHWRNPSKIEYIERGLDDLVHIINQYEIKSIAIPALGAGLGGLNWNEVKKVIENKLRSLENIEIYVFEPQKKISKEITKNIEKKPRLSLERKQLLLLIDHYNIRSKSSLATYVQIHQLSYLLNFRNSDLNFDLFKSGTYSYEINQILLRLNNHFLIPTEQVNNCKKMKVNTSAISNLKEVTNSKELIEAFSLIDGFENEKDLLNLTVSHWVMFNKFTNSFEENKIEYSFKLVELWYEANSIEFDSNITKKALNRISKIYTKYENLEFNL